MDLGLRDVGVTSDPRRFAAQLGKALLAVAGLVVVSALAMCALILWTGASAPMLAVFMVAWMGGVLALFIRMLKRSQPLVVKVNAEGTNQATWVLLAMCVLPALHTLVLRDLLLMPMLALTLVTALFLWRARGRVPDALRGLRELLAANETVLGDGIGLARGARGREAFRVVVATDQRLLVATSTHSTERFLLIDAPYRHVSRFGIEWRLRGRVGVLSLTVPGLDGASDTHVIDRIAPANLVSIARALQSQGVPADDPAVIADAERGWEEALRGGAPPEPLLDRAAMRTREFDRGLWLLLGLFAVTFYLHPFGVGVGLLLAVAVLSVVCGYASGTTSALAYIAPLNLLIAPGFFLWDADDVIAVMIVLSALAAVCLWAGSALRGRVAMSPGPRAPRGSLRNAISGLGLVRISSIMLAVVVTLVATAAAAGFELSTIRWAVDEATARQLPVDGRSNLTGNAASLTYTPGPDLREFVTDEDWGAGPNDGARWELRSSFTKGYNVISLAHYIFEPRLDDPAAVADFVADKDDEHSRIAGFRVPHKKRVIDGRRGYVWTHGGRSGYWHYVAWFPQPVHSIRVECVARKEIDRFKRLCADATKSLEFH